MGDYVDLDGVRTWFEVRGPDGAPPVVLLHGGLTDSRDFTGNLDRLAGRFRVFLPERRGHGHSPDVEGPFTIGALTADMVGFLAKVVGGPAHVVGYSAGAIVALHLAADRPDLVDRLVLISGAADPDALLVRPTAGGEPPAPLLQAYAEVSPDGAGHFPVIIEKIAAAAQQGRRLDLTDLVRLTRPVLVVSADDDFVTLEHTVALYHALPDAALAVVPSASHLLLHEHPDRVAAMVGDFLADALPARLLPVQRAGT